jgi:hypothetical protein
MNLVAENAMPALLRASAVASLVVGGVCALGLPAHAFKPAYTTRDRLGTYYTESNYSSFGFFFDTTQDLLIDGLGFAPQLGWPAGSSAYNVNLWSFKNGGSVATDYKLEASSIFTPGNPYVVQAGYCWQSITPILLPNTSFIVDPSNQTGYVISALGDFTDVPGNVKYEIGTPMIDPNFDFSGNAYGDSATADGFFPIPIQEKTGLRINGYFNPNLSYVPGPLPIFGVASALGLTRKMRNRIKQSKTDPEPSMKSCGVVPASGVRQ